MYRDFAKKQLDNATTHPKLKLIMIDRLDNALRKSVRYRKNLWEEAVNNFQQALFYYKADNLTKADEYLTFGLLSGEMII